MLSLNIKDTCYRSEKPIYLDEIERKRVKTAPNQICLLKKVPECCDPDPETLKKSQSESYI